MTCQDVADKYIALTKEDAPWIHKLRTPGVYLNVQDPYDQSNPKFVSTRTMRDPKPWITDSLRCRGSVILNTGVSYDDVVFGAYMDTDGVLWIGGYVATFYQNAVGVNKYNAVYTDGKGNYLDGTDDGPCPNEDVRRELTSAGPYKCSQ